MRMIFRFRLSGWRFFQFVSHIPGYWRLERKQGYEPVDYDFIIRQYTDVLLHITEGRLSKPTYFASDIIAMAEDLRCEGCELKEEREAECR